MQPRGWQPTRLPRPRDSPGKSTGVGCHFLFQCMKVKSESQVAQSCLTLHDSMDCSPSGSSIHGIFQARVLEWGAIAFSYLLPFFRQLHNFIFPKLIFWTKNCFKRLLQSSSELKFFPLREFVSQNKWKPEAAMSAKRGRWIRTPQPSCNNSFAWWSNKHGLVLKILQARLQQYVNRELPDAPAGLEKAEEPEIK